MNVVAAVVQMTGRPGAPADNRLQALTKAQIAIAAGAQLVVLPELCISGYTLNRDHLEGAAEPFDGPTLAAFRGLAAQSGALIAAGFCERDRDRLYNSAMLVGAEGVLLHYRKLHLFDREKLVFAPGEPRDAMGLIAQVRGAMLQANLNQVHVVCAGQAGRTDDTEFLGSSMIADPYGNILAGPLGHTDENIAMASLDLAAVRSAQQRSSLIRPRLDRRTDTYGLKIGDRVL